MAGENTAFFYGTLMAEEVFYSVCYGFNNPPKAIRDLHTFTPAVLDDYCRHRVRYADYPGIIPEKGRSVLGIYATGLTDANIQKLDYFEGSEYEKVGVKVTLANKEGQKTDNEIKDTTAYVFLKAKDLEMIEWNFEEFRSQKMQLWTRGDWAFDPESDDKAQERST